jgi:ATP-dependent helicase HrpA
MRELGPLTTTLAPLEDLQRDAFGSIRQWVTDPDRVLGRASRPGEVRPGVDGIRALTQDNFTSAVEKAKADLRGLVPRFVDLLREILTLRQELLVLPEPPSGLARDLTALVPPQFLRTTPFAQLAHLPRYLKALKLRAERARKNPGKDAERSAQLAPYLAVLDKVRDREGGESFRWLVEEFRVSLFAQELGTAEPVSVVKLDRVLAAIQSGKGARAESAATTAPAPAAPKPIVSLPVTEKKLAPLKNLSALDKLFRP